MFRNPEIKRDLFLYVLLSVVFVSFSFYLNIKFGIAAVVFCLVFIIIYFISCGMRYKKIRELSSDINKILHGENAISLNKYSEGELAILHSEIYKMTVCLREQHQKLLDDKIYLADSIADISHQIRTPLTSINLLVQFLSEPDISEERRQKTSHELYTLLSRIDWLITSLLKISKLDAGTVTFKKENITLEELIRKACDPIAVAMELRNQSLVINADGNFTGDISWTQEALCNIVKNCMEHTPQNGKIEITASENALYSEIIIRDNGVGIASEDLPHIFERFYKGKNSDGKSFGIGLALSRMIVVNQKGTVKAENGLPNGAVFTIRFYKGTI